MSHDSFKWEGEDRPIFDDEKIDAEIHALHESGVVADFWLFAKHIGASHKAANARAAHLVELLKYAMLPDDCRDQDLAILTEIRVAIKSAPRPQTPESTSNRERAEERENEEREDSRL